MGLFNLFGKSKQSSGFVNYSENMQKLADVNLSLLSSLMAAEKEYNKLVDENISLRSDIEKLKNMRG